jgi:hypothetical protein
MTKHPTESKDPFQFYTVMGLARHSHYASAI